MLRPIILTIIVTLLAAQLPALARPKPSSITQATLTEAHGDVYKRGFKDWERDLWADPQPASVGDSLSEGMQVGTGNKSWAELQWPNISARAWENSVYAIAPNKRLVYLVGGEMLYHLDKNRQDKSPYYVWTNLLQARIRGTTVLFQATPTVSRITVLEGCVDVMNRKDHSVVRLKPGFVYELATKDTAENSQSNSSSEPQLTKISKSDAPAIPVYDTKTLAATVKVADPDALLHHPLLSSFSEPLISLPLCQSTLTPLVATIGGLADTVEDIASSKLFKSAFELLAVPTTTAYRISSSIDVSPQVMQYFTPEGWIGSGNRLLSQSGAPLLGNANMQLPNLAGTGAFGAGLPYANTAAGAALAQQSATVSGVVSGVGAVGLGGINTFTGTTASLGTIGGILPGTVHTTTGLINNTVGATGLTGTGGGSLLSPVNNLVNTLLH